MPFVQQEFMSLQGLVTIACIMAAAGLLFTKGAMDMYTAALLFVLAGLFFVMRDGLPRELAYISAVAALVFALFQQKGISSFNLMLQLMALAAMLFACKIYLMPEVLLNLSIIITLVIAFIFLI